MEAKISPKANMLFTFYIFTCWSHHKNVLAVSKQRPFNNKIALLTTIDKQVTLSNNFPHLLHSVLLIVGIFPTMSLNLAT